MGLQIVGEQFVPLAHASAPTVVPGLIGFGPLSGPQGLLESICSGAKCVLPTCVAAVDLDLLSGVGDEKGIIVSCYQVQSCQN